MKDDDDWDVLAINAVNIIFKKTTIIPKNILVAKTKKQSKMYKFSLIQSMYEQTRFAWFGNNYHETSLAQEISPENLGLFTKW